VTDDVHIPQWVWALGGLAGLGFIALGGLLVFLPLIMPAAFEGVVVVVAGYGFISLTVGLCLCGVGLRGWQNHSSRRVYSKWAWGLFLALSLIIGAIGASFPAEHQSGFLFAPFHFALITLPGLLLFSLVSLLAGSDAAISIRRMLLAVVGGASSIILALPVEFIGMMFSSLVGAALTLLTPGGEAEIDRIVQLMMRWVETPPSDEAEIMGLLASPLVLMTLGLTLAVITPIVEEFGKTLVMGFLGIWSRSSLLPSFLMGAACGLGFAWFEGVGNGALGLGASSAWGISVSMRFLATAMHALTSGILGLGWGWFWRRRRWALPLCYAISVLLHGLWNLNVVLSLAGAALSTTSEMLGTVIIISGVSVQVALTGVVLVALVSIPLVLRRREGAVLATS
jgi:hypothetical protein